MFKKKTIITRIHDFFFNFLVSSPFPLAYFLPLNPYLLDITQFSVLSILFSFTSHELPLN